MAASSLAALINIVDGSAQETIPPGFHMVEEVAAATGRSVRRTRDILMNRAKRGEMEVRNVIYNGHRHKAYKALDAK